MRNKYPGTCYRCGLHVAAGQGHFELTKGAHGSKWRTQHAICAITWRGKPAPTKSVARGEFLKSIN